MKRILFISQYLNRAGTETFMMNIFRGIDHSRFMVDFLLYSRNVTNYAREVEAAGCHVWRVPSRRDSLVGWYLSLYMFYKHHARDYEAIHFCGNVISAIAPIAFAYLFRIPIRISHSHSSSASGWHNKVLHLIHRGLARRITTHHFACSTLAAKWFFGNSPAVIVNNGIDALLFAYNVQVRKMVRESLELSPSTILFGNVGRFQSEKNHTFLLDIFSAYIDKNSNAKLMLIGTGALMDEIKEKAAQLGISNKTLFLGERSDVPQLLQAMDLFLMPSTFEGQPFVLIEAQCAGLPCLISDVINQDICLTDNVERCSLRQQAVEWAAKAESMLTGFCRKDESKVIEQKGYAIKQTIAYLERVYDGKE